MEATTYGYARVSAKDQCEERQLIALRKFPVAEANIFLDKVSGKDFNPQPTGGSYAACAPAISW